MKKHAQTRIAASRVCPFPLGSASGHDPTESTRSTQACCVCLLTCGVVQRRYQVRDVTDKPPINEQRPRYRTRHVGRTLRVFAFIRREGTSPMVDDTNGSAFRRASRQKLRTPRRGGHLVAAVLRESTNHATRSTITHSPSHGFYQEECMYQHRR
jgi:hypothetical protein